MSSTNAEEKTVPWALKTFRPLLKDLRLQNVSSEPRVVFASAYKVFNRYNMANCVVVVKAKEFSDKHASGIFILQYNEDTQLYALHIIINKNLFKSDDIKLRIKRKAAGVHEFTHCVAAMLTFRLLQSKVLIEILNKRMEKKIHSLNKKELEDLLWELVIPVEEKKRNGIAIFPDEHFRTGSEDFPGSYEELWRNFLLSFDLFCEEPFFTEEKQNQFKAFLKEDKKREAAELLASVIQPLSEAKALEPRFIIQRIKEEFMERIR